MDTGALAQMNPGEATTQQHADDRQTLYSTLLNTRETLGSKASIPSLMAVLQEYPCMARAKSELLSRHYEPVDRYYSDRHELLRKLTLELLAIRLREKKKKFSLTAENKTPFGTGDIDVRAVGSSIDVAANDLKIRIELKGGNFTIDQVLRYLLDADNVVLCLAGRGTALTIKREDVVDLLSLVTRTYTAKAQALGSVDLVKDRTAGPWCSGCAVSCEHAKAAYIHRVDLRREFVLAAKTWTSAIEAAVEETMTLLETHTEVLAA